MDRDRLIRAHFEAMRDLTWAQVLEPKFQEHGVDAKEINAYRDAWNLHAERKDWAWWQQEAKGNSTAQMQDALMECIEQLNAIGLLQWRQETVRSGEEQFQEIVNASRDHADSSVAVGNTQEMGTGRKR